MSLNSLHYAMFTVELFDYFVTILRDLADDIIFFSKPKTAYELVQ